VVKELVAGKERAEEGKDVLLRRARRRGEAAAMS